MSGALIHDPDPTINSWCWDITESFDLLITSQELWPLNYHFPWATIKHYTLQSPKHIHQGCIYMINNTVKRVILWNVTSNISRKSKQEGSMSKKSIWVVPDLDVLHEAMAFATARERFPSSSDGGRKTLPSAHPCLLKTFRAGFKSQ